MGARKGKWRIWIIVAGLALVGAAILQTTVIYTEKGAMCAYTFSRREHKEWPFGLESAHVQFASPLEEFLADEAPDRIAHKWWPVRHVGMSLYGQPTLFVDGVPPPGYGVDWNRLEDWIAASSKEEVLDLYELLKSGDRIRIGHKVQEINAFPPD